MVTVSESRDPQDAIGKLTTCLNAETLLDLARRFSEVYRSLAKNSIEHFLVTPVTVLPSGKEKGKFLAIDVGGSNLRVGFVELVGDLATFGNHGYGKQEVGSDVSPKIKRSHDKSWPIGDHLKTDRPKDLFLWIGDCMAEVVREAINGSSISWDQEILLGVTFSFPMAQTSLSEATLLPMGKGFTITTNLNLGEMLLAGYSRHCTQTKNSLPPIRVSAITNDTVATLISSAYTIKATPDSRVSMGLIVGTGTNATVPMRLSALHPSKQKHLHSLGAKNIVIINTEWTIRGTDTPLDALGIKTPWDQLLAQQSESPGFQPFEYMTSGRYLGEIVRLVFLHTVSTDPASKGIVPASLHRKNGLPTIVLSETVARADAASLSRELEIIFPSTNTKFWTLTRAQLLKSIARAVQQRSSALIAAACLGLLDCVGDISLAPISTSSAASNKVNVPDAEELVIAYAGSTISQYPHWLEDCQRWVDGIVAKSGMGGRKRVVLREALDGGIVGAGVLAGMGAGT